MEFYGHERTALFIDGADLNATTEALGFEIDFRKLLELFRDTTRLIRAAYYVQVADTPEHDWIRPLVDWLAYNGYVTSTRTLKDGAVGHLRQSPSMAVEMTIDALQILPSLDHLVLLSGSPEFSGLAAAFQKAGRRVTVVSSRKAHDSSIADELRRQCDQFVDLAELRSKIAFDNEVATQSDAGRSGRDTSARNNNGTRI